MNREKAMQAHRDALDGIQTTLPQSSLWAYLEYINRNLQNKRLADVFRFISFTSGETYGPHTHLRIEINYVKKGSCILHLNDRAVRFREGEIMIISSHVNHLFEAGREGSTLMQLEFLPEIFTHFQLNKPSDAGNTETSPLFPFGEQHQLIKIVDNIRIEHSLRRIIRELEAKGPYYQHLVMMYYAELFVLIHRHLEEVQLPIDANETMKKAIGYMRNNYLAPLTIRQVARQVGVSDRHLRTLFHTHLGQSPLEYLNRIRMKKAITLLQDTDLSVKEICFQCGFQSPQYFSRIFKRHMGVSPRNITKNKSGADPQQES